MSSAWQTVFAPFFSCEQIAAALGPAFRLANIEANWPLISSALHEQGISSRSCEIAAAATTAVETGTFSPCRERGGPAYLIGLYWTNQAKAYELGNLSADDAVRYRGRGDVQITGRANYERYGVKLGLDLVNQPDLALEPAPAARILALYFAERKVHVAAEQGNWERVRRRVNGGLNGWADFKKYVDALSAIRAA